MKQLKIRKFANRSKPVEWADEAHTLPTRWALDRVVVQDEPPLDHVISRQYVEQATEEGWMVILDDVLEIRASNMTVRYQIIEPPGRHDDPNAPGGYRVEHQYTLHLIYPR